MKSLLTFGLLFLTSGSGDAQIAATRGAFECNPPITLEECGHMARSTEGYIRAYRERLPANWSWWVVPSSRWRAVVGPAAKLTSWAVTDPVDHVTVLNLDLFRADRKDVLEFALAHEASHVICHFDMFHEQDTNVAARRLLSGQQEICRHSANEQGAESRPVSDRETVVEYAHRSEK